MITTINEFRKILENSNAYKFVEDYYDYHHGQSDARMDMYLNDTAVAFAQYSKYKDKIQVNYIESIDKGKGYGTELMKELARLYGYENLERASLTEDGVKMRKRLDKHFNFDYDKHQESLIKHLDADVLDKIKDPIVKSFMKDMMTIGYQSTWDKYGDKLRESGLTSKYDFNDISEICNWIKGSITNNNQDTNDVPEFIIKDLEKLT